MLQWGDLFTVRQKAALIELLNVVQGNGAIEVEPALACALNRVAMSDMSCTRWNAVAEKMQDTFGRQALPIVRDFAEVVVTAGALGNWKSGYELIADVIDADRSVGPGQVQACEAADCPPPDQAAAKSGCWTPCFWPCRVTEWRSLFTNDKPVETRCRQTVGSRLVPRLVRPD